jgi:prevent-host-death family protein
MSTKTFSSRAFNRRANEAKKAADHGPVFITNRGKPAYVLLSIGAYTGLTTPRENIAALLAMSDVGDFELPVPPRRGAPKAVELD